MGTRMIFLYVGNCLVLTGVRNGHESSCPLSSDSSVWQMEMSLSILVARPPFFLALLVFAPASGSTLPASLSAAAPASAEVSSWPALALVSAVSSSSSSAVLKI